MSLLLHEQSVWIGLNPVTTTFSVKCTHTQLDIHISYAEEMIPMKFLTDAEKFSPCYTNITPLYVSRTFFE